jgi:hypothetical protein
MKNVPHDDQHELNRALDLLIDGSLPVPEARVLQERMKTDAALLSLYLAKVHTHSLLLDHDWSDKAQPAKSRPAHRIFTGQRLAWAAVLAGLLTVSALVLFRRDATDKESVAGQTLPSLQFSAVSEYNTDSSSLPGDGKLPYGHGIVMADGSVSIRLPSGVEAVLKSPSRFAIMGANRLKLDQGTGWFRVPPAAKGFAVDLPDMEVVDLGTVFTVFASDSEQRVQVEEGRVEVRQRMAGSSRQELKAGENLVRRANAEVVQGSGEAPLLDPGAFTEKPEVVFHEALSGVPNQPFAERKPLVGTWQVLEGKPQIINGRFAAESSFTHLMGRFTRPIEPSANAVIMVSFKSVSPASLFHSRGFAGISLFDGDGELFFLGDKSSNSYSWELLSYGGNYRGPKEERRAFDLNVQGSEETFTLRYRQRTGSFEVYRGWGVQGLPVVRGKTDPGLRVDGVRVANGRGGDFSFEAIEVSVVKDRAN